ncbi:rotatin [Elysia marginata]|uniref:Rotatin n=1 Tax=Elysia marginata TaxID=1093978 RepID=A0AAV4JYA3_9GAST|nr:rotatin [Elysia marginata]
MLIGSCEFLADVVFQDFPAEIFLQRPEIIKSLLSLVSMPNRTDHSVVIQACKTLTVFIRCLQVRIRYFQDPALYTSKQDFNSTTPSSTLNSGPPSSCYSAQQGVSPSTLVRAGSGGFTDHRDRGDGKDGDSSSSVSRDSSVGLEPDQNNGDLLNLLDMDAAQPQHQQLSLPQLLVAVLQRALPRLRTAELQLGTAVLELSDEALAVLRCVLDQGLWSDTRDAAREVVDRLTDCLDCIGDLLGFHHHDQHNDSPLDPELGELTTHRILYMGVAATVTRFLIMIPIDKKASDKHLAALAEDALPSLGYHLHLPFVSKFVNFISILCSKKKSDKVAVAQCTSILLKLLAFPVESVREMCHTALLDAIQVRKASSDCFHHLLQSQMLMSEGLWQELMLALTKALPLLQSYTDESTPLGRRLWSLLDPTTSTHNISLLDKLRASLRLMYLADRKVRTNAAKHVKWFLCNEQGSVNRFPSSSDLDLGDLCSILMTNMTNLLEEDSSPSVFTEEGMMQVFEIFTSNPVDPDVKKSAGDQLATMLRDPHLHALFKEKGGVEDISSTIQKAVEASKDEADNKATCVAMLKNLLHHDYSLRHTMARDNNLYNTLLRVSLLLQEELTVKTDVSHVMVLLLFDEVAKFDIRFCAILQLTEIERTVLELSCVSWQLHSCLASIKTAGSHAEVTSYLNRMLAYAVAVPGQALTQFLTNSQNWYTVLERFLNVTPISNCDQRLLQLVLKFISSGLQCVRSHFSVSNPVTPTVLTWLIDKIYKPDGPLMSLLKKSVGPAEEGIESAATNTIKRSLDKQILQFVISVNLSLPYQLCKRTPPVLMRGDFVNRLQRRLNISEAPHFYNLASLEGTLSCLMNVTARPGWSKECSELDTTSLCNQLLNSLLEVIWSFHIGRGGTSLSFMGKGVTKSTALCLRHLAYEMYSNSDDKDWVKNWLYKRQDGSLETDQGLNWLITLWAYRDSEVRVAGLGIAVALTSTEAGRLLVASSCKHIPGGIWGAAFSILLDPVECSMVCQQAALLLVNLTSQTMPSGCMETAGGATTWQGPVVTDEDYQMVLQGISALEALVSHTNLYASVSDLLTNVCWVSLVQPVLVNIELPPVLEDTSLLSSSSDTVSGASDQEKTGRTALTTVTRESGHHSPSASARSKPMSTGGSQGTAPDTSLSSSTATDISQLRRQGGQGKDVASDEGHSVTTPGLVAAVVRLLNNLVQLSPRSCLSGLQAHGILSSLLRHVNPSRVQTLCEEMTTFGKAGYASAPALCNLLAMYSSIADLLTTCVTIDTNARGELLANRADLGALASLVLFQWHGKDDIGSVCTSLSVSVLRLLSSLLQTQGPAALISLSAVLGPIWSPFAESMASVLADRTPDGLPLLGVSLDFLALLLTEESRSLIRDPDRILETATLSELLDTQIDEGAAQKADTPEVPGPSTTGKLLCQALVKLFEPAMAVSWEEKASKIDKVEGDLRLKLLSALKAVLAVSHTAKQTALDSGIVETTIEQLKQTHAQLNLETLGVTKLTGRKEGPLLQELVMILDFLRTFMCDNVDVKVACHHSGLTGVLQRLWAWCQQEPSLLSCVLSLLTTYCAYCNSAASSFTNSVSATLPPTGSGKSVGGTGSNSGSLLHYVLKLAQRELDRDECSPLLRLIFGLLTNLALNSDCRTVLWKSPFVNQFSQLNPRKRKGKIRAAVDLLWCDLILALSFSVDGQQIILKIPDSLTVLMDLMEAGSSLCQRSATLVVRNLCCHAPNKPKLLAAERIVSVLMQQIEGREDEEIQLIATSALWALVYNNHKARVQVKAQNVAARLVDVLHRLQASTSQRQSQAASSSCLNLKAVIMAVRD